MEVDFIVLCVEMQTRMIFTHLSVVLLLIQFGVNYLERGCLLIFLPWSNGGHAFVPKIKKRSIKFLVCFGPYR